MNALIRRAAPALVVLSFGGRAPATPPAMTFEQAVKYALPHPPAVAGSFVPLAGVPGSSGPVGTTGLGGGAAWTNRPAVRIVISQSDLGIR